jgi:hypothetical protein
MGGWNMFCQSCGIELTSGAAVCPKCNQKVQPLPAYGPPAPYPYMYHYPFQFWKSNLAGFFFLMASVFCLLSAIYVYVDWITYYIYYPEDYYYDYDVSGIYIWIVIFCLGILGFGFGLVSSIMCFKRTRFYIPVLGSTIIIIASFFMFFDYYSPFGFLTLMMGLPGGTLLILGKSDFDMPADKSQPYYPPPPIPYPPYPPYPQPLSPKPSPAVKLMELQKLKEKEIITQEEFDSKKKELLDKF